MITLLSDEIKKIQNEVKTIDDDFKKAFILNVLDTGSLNNISIKWSHNDAFKTNRKELMNQIKRGVRNYKNDWLFDSVNCIIWMQELNRFIKNDNTEFTADDFKHVYTLIRSSYNSAMYAWRWMQSRYQICRNYDDKLRIPMTASMLAAYETSLKICEALIQDELPSYSFTARNSHRMLSKTDTDGRVGLVGVDALANATVNMISTGYPVEFIKESALIDSDDDKIPDTHDNKNAYSDWNKSMTAIRKSYTDSLMLRMLYIAGHMRHDKNDNIIMQSYASDEKVKEWITTHDANVQSDSIENKSSESSEKIETIKENNLISSTLEYIF